MKSIGVNNEKTFIVTDTAPIIEIIDGKAEESDKKILKGTIIKGLLKTRVVNIGKEKKSYKFIQLSDKKGYFSPQAVNLYIGDFANQDGLAKSNDTTPVRSTSFGQDKPGLWSRTKKATINYGLPIAGAVIGYKIAKKMDADSKKTIAYVLVFGLLGCIPRFIRK